MRLRSANRDNAFYSHVNFSVTKIVVEIIGVDKSFTVT